MELVGVYAHGADKVGVDAAELSGWPEPTGVTATNDIDALLALKPDACCYNPLWPNIDELTRLLEAGVNVCSSAAWITGGKQSPEDLDRIRKACEKGNSTIFGSGAHPGMTNLVGMVLSGSCERVDEIRITESVDCSTYESAGTQTAMGFSQDPDTPGLAESVRRESEVFAESAAMMADAIGAKLDKITFDVTFTPATGDTDLGFMQIPKGTVGGVYGYHRGWVGDRNVVSVGFNWIMGDHVTPPKPLEHGHVIQVFGLPNMRTVLHCLPPKDWTEPGFMGLGMIYTAHAGDQRGARRRRRPAGHRDAEGPAADHRPRRRCNGSNSAAANLALPGPSRSSSAALRPAIAINNASPLPRTSGPFPYAQSMSVATRRTPRARQAPRMVGAKRAKSSAVRSRSGSMVRGRPIDRRMSCWWIMPSVSAILPPNPPVSPCGSAFARMSATICSGDRSA